MSKVIAIIDKPMGCKFCSFSVCQWSCPPWAIHNAIRNNTQGYRCLLVEKDKRETFVMEYGNTTYTWDKCPLIPYKEDKQ